MSNKKKIDNKDKLQMKIVKKISRDTFLTKDTLTKVAKDKTTYCRKIKHKKPKDLA